jgi:polysaccharide deacetylase family protein (PEP-CTERM system associated)
MTVDVEDYFHVSAFENHIERSSWKSMQTRLPENVDRILELLAPTKTKATFFTLGWVCRRHPGVVRKIAAEGHEVASHGNQHSRIGTMDRDAFYHDVRDTRSLLEDTSGGVVRGYRAPSFSLDAKTLWAHEVLAEAGYEYSSSVFPISHDHYGLPGAPRFPFLSASGGILEIPMATLSVLGRNWPCAGGGYFRLLPVSYFKWAIRHINEKEQMPAMFYFHPWELDPGQPRVRGVPLRSKFRHYVNLAKFESRLVSMLTSFEWGRADEIFLGRQ